MFYPSGTAATPADADWRRSNKADRVALCLLGVDGLFGYSAATTNARTLLFIPL